MPNADPDRLVVPGRHAGHVGRGVEPVDHHEAEAVQQEDYRHDDGVRLGGEVPVGEMDDESQARGHADELQGVGRQHSVGAERREQVRQREHHDRDEEQTELAPAPLSHPWGDCEGLHDFTVASGS